MKTSLLFSVLGHMKKTAIPKIISNICGNTVL